MRGPMMPVPSFRATCVPYNRSICINPELLTFLRRNGPEAATAGAAAAEAAMVGAAAAAAAAARAAKAAGAAATAARAVQL